MTLLLEVLVEEGQAPLDHVDAEGVLQIIGSAVQVTTPVALVVVPGADQQVAAIGPAGNRRTDTSYGQDVSDGSSRGRLW